VYYTWVITVHGYVVLYLLVHASDVKEASSMAMSPSKNLVTRISKEESLLSNFEAKFECFQHLKYNMSHIIVKQCCIINQNEINNC
jgi:hypothetical protein